MKWSADGPATDDLEPAGPGLFGLLWRHRRVLALATLAGILAGAAFASLQPTLYEAVTRVVLPAPVRDPDTGSPVADPERVLANQVALLESRPVLEAAIRRFSPGSSVATIRRRVEVVPSKRADTIDIRARDVTPEGAVRLANAALAGYEEVAGGEAARLNAAARERLRERKAALDRRAGELYGLGGDPANRRKALLELQVVNSFLADVVNTRPSVKATGVSGALRQPPELPTRPVYPDYARTLLIGALLGLAAGALVVWQFGTRPPAPASSASPAYAPPSPAPAPTRPFRWFAPALALLLCGYLFFSKPFAYLHLPGSTVFLGELVLGIGVLEAVRARKLLRGRLELSGPLAGVVALMTLGAVRMLVDLPRYGMDAVRDSAIWYYGAYALLVAAAVAADPTFTARLAAWFRRVLPLFLLWVPVAILLTQVRSLGRVTVLGSDTAINSFKSGDLSVMAGVALAFVWLGLERIAGRRPERRRDDVVTIVGVLTLLVLMSQSRGGLLAIATVLGTALLCMTAPARRRALLTAAGGIALILVPVFLLDVKLELGYRDLSPRQVALNAFSLVDDTAREGSDRQTGLEATFSWREQYFGTIIRDSLTAEHVLTGQGFGTIMSYKYIPRESQAAGAQPLRNAHNSHLTILARTGVPGLALWLAMLLAFVHTVGGVALAGRRGERHPDVRVAALALGGVLGFCVLAATDPSLEGPQGGVWFWSLLGFGCAHAAAWRRRAARAAVAVTPAAPIALTDRLVLGR